MTFFAWPEIELFHNIRKFIKLDPNGWWQNEVAMSSTNKIAYKAKVKLHGTNAAIQLHGDGKVVAQSRENVITTDKDNAGFARWVFSNEHLWSKVALESCQDLVIYGEWIGPGIQRGVAVSEIPRKVFAVFAARPMDPAEDYLIVEPEELQRLVKNIPDTYVLPWYGEQVEIDWSLSDEQIAKAIAPINDWVAAIEANDPWVEATFGIKGTGEGLVLYPTLESQVIGFDWFQNLVFKAKGEKHKNIATAKPAQVNPEMAASVDAFVILALTYARLEQGARAVMGEHKHNDTLQCVFCTTGALTYDNKQTGKFVQWILSDVEKETQAELAASSLTWKQVQKAISDVARTWYLTEAKK